jgi:23S rRNA (uracil747-C5)-methyltransferase
MGFRNKAKLAVHGKAGRLIFGLPANLASRLGFHDLSDCGLYEPGITSALPHIKVWLNRLGIAPYQLSDQSGELKYVLLSIGAKQALMLRLVLANERWRSRIADALPTLQLRLPNLIVTSINVQPVHQAIVEGPLEIVLSDVDMLQVSLNDVALKLMPQSFFQTNTLVAAKLYQSAREWLALIQPATIWDLYCGVGGFGLHLATDANSLLGVELSQAAISSARQAASTRGLSSASFIAGDALSFARTQTSWPDLVLLNPPRRGVDAELCALIEASRTRYVLYSSCNTDSLARDVSRLPSFKVIQAQLFDMFPNTEHAEVLVLLRRD